MTKKALPETDLDSILIYITFVILVVIAVILAGTKVKQSFSARTNESGYSRPTWTETGGE